MEGLGTRLPDTLHLELDLEELHLKCKLCVGNSYSWSELFLVHPLFFILSSNIILVFIYSIVSAPRILPPPPSLPLSPPSNEFSWVECCFGCEDGHEWYSPAGKGKYPVIEKAAGLTPDFYFRKITLVIRHILQSWNTFESSFVTHRLEWFSSFRSFKMMFIDFKLAQ